MPMWSMTISCDFSYFVKWFSLCIHNHHTFSIRENVDDDDIKILVRLHSHNNGCPPPQQKKSWKQKSFILVVVKRKMDDDDQKKNEFGNEWMNEEKKFK